ncbi:MAG: hypothetical protein ACFFD2_21705 [Promethearchaeota archaeon]
MSEEEPPIQFYEVIDFKTITRKGTWWILLALCREMESRKTFLAFYKFQKRKNQDGKPYWQKKTSFRWNNIKHIPKILDTIKELTKEWEKQEEELLP